MKTFKKARKQLKWGTYGITGKDPVRWVRVKDLSTNHIHNILKTQHHIRDDLRILLEMELMYRSEQVRKIHQPSPSESL